MTGDYSTPRGFEEGAAGSLRFIHDRGIWRGGGDVSRRMTQAQLARLVRGAPEVIVKVSSRIYTASNLRRHLDYISRSGALGLEGPDGEIVETTRQAEDLAERWIFEARMANCGPSIAVSLVLSMPHGAPSLNVLTAASTFAEHTFRADRPYVLVLHEDQAHPHVHLTVHSLGRAAAKLDPDKAMFRLWRETFADHLRMVGVDAEASPRWARGVVQRRDKTPLYQMRERLLAGEGSVPAVLEAAVADAKDAVLGRWREPEEHASAVAFQAAVRERFGAEAALLRASSIASERRFGEAAAAFVGALPAPLTRHLMYVGRLEKETGTRSVNPSRDRASSLPAIRRDVARSR